MTVIRVNPESIQAYARDAMNQFGRARDAMQALANDVVGVHYFGPNAVSFKTQCGTLAEDYAKKLISDLGQIADAVRASTSNIAASLGGMQINITFDGAPISAPKPAPGDGSVDIDVDALMQLKPVVDRRFAEIVAALDAHLRTLEGTDWVGQAKETARGAVSSMTSKAKSNAVEAQQSIVRYIDEQITAAQTADK